MFKRSSGILVHISSLPGPFGTGTLGNQARKFADLLVQMGCSYWQILPINHPTEGYSPYSPRSVFAINPNFIDLYDLESKGLLTLEEINDARIQPNQKTQDAAILEKKRLILLHKAFSRISDSELDAVKAFAAVNAEWLDPYALFTVLRNNFGDMHWNEWPVIGLRLHKPDAIAKAYADYKNDVMFWKYVQYTAYRQWADFRKYVNGLGISLIGDIPIYASFDSSDVWAGNRLFQLNTKHIPKRVGGVPPDYFNKNGQLWGNPLYNWAEMKKDGYKWWMSRIDNALGLFDVLRLDHFRGLYNYWAVPFANKTAKKGDWLKGPGMELIRKIRARHPDNPFIMEDLGSLDRHAKKFLDSTGYPGMRVMQFGFGPDGETEHLTKNYPTGCVAYTGTHDNNTIIGWYGDVTEEIATSSFEVLGLSAVADKPVTNEEICRAWLENLFGSKSDLVIVPIQDLLFEGSEARINFPGTTSAANWTYRVTEDKLNAIDKDWVAQLNRKTKRLHADGNDSKSSDSGSISSISDSGNDSGISDSGQSDNKTEKGGKTGKAHSTRNTASASAPDVKKGKKTRATPK